MFDDEHNSLFEDADDFGVQAYREDINVLINMNSVVVKVTNVNPKVIDTQQGDFLGIKTKIYDGNHELVKICINSNNAENDKLTEDGYSGRGEVRFNCYAIFSTDISNKATVEFLVDYSFGIKEGDKFRVEMKETGPWQGQYSYKNFDIIKID